jgi:hypothetical protein
MCPVGSLYSGDVWVFKRFQHRVQPAGGRHAVIVGEQDNRALGLKRATVPGCGRAGICLANQANADVALDDVFGVVG